MGLDNIPTSYPCRAKGTAITDEQGRIICDETQKSGGCPWLNIKEKDPLVSELSGIYGMMGVDCWYRGKFGNYLFETMSNFNEDFPFDGNAFYGDIDEDEDSGGGLSPEYSLLLAKVMDDFSESWSHYCSIEYKDSIDKYKEMVNNWIYTSWWLKFSANECEGSEIWY